MKKPEITDKMVEQWSYGYNRKHPDFSPPSNPDADDAAAEERNITFLLQLEHRWGIPDIAYHPEFIRPPYGASRSEWEAAAGKVRSFVAFADMAAANEAAAKAAAAKAEEKAKAKAALEAFTARQAEKTTRDMARMARTRELLVGVAPWGETEADFLAMLGQVPETPLVAKYRAIWAKVDAELPEIE
jgi:hypothetical protein